MFHSDRQPIRADGLTRAGRDHRPRHPPRRGRSDRGDRAIPRRVRQADLIEATVEIEGLGVRFLTDRQRRPVTPALARMRRMGASAWGIRDLNLSFEPGESVGLIGPSGSGKTTLLRAIAGVLPADAGAVRVRGRVGCLLSTDAGLEPRLTGRENVLLLGVLAGLSRTEGPRGAGKYVPAGCAPEHGERPGGGPLRRGEGRLPQGLSSSLAAPGTDRIEGCRVQG